jgi:hypothetical protein
MILMLCIWKMLPCHPCLWQIRCADLKVGVLAEHRQHVAALERDERRFFAKNQSGLLSFSLCDQQQQQGALALSYLQEDKAIFILLIWCQHTDNSHDECSSAVFHTDKIR